VDLSLAYMDQKSINELAKRFWNSSDDRHRVVATARRGVAPDRSRIEGDFGRC
jgi:hypothetical protein